MTIYKWTRNSLIKIGQQGYKAIHCDSESEVEELRKKLKEDKLCAQPGYAINKDNETIYFVLTKSKNNEPLGNVYKFGRKKKKIYNIGG